MPDEEEIGDEPENGNPCACPFKGFSPKARICGKMVVKWNEDHHQMFHQDHNLKKQLNEPDIGFHLLLPERVVEEGMCCVHGRCCEGCLHNC